MRGDEEKSTKLSSDLHYLPWLTWPPPQTRNKMSKRNIILKLEKRLIMQCLGIKRHQQGVQRRWKFTHLMVMMMMVMTIMVMMICPGAGEMSWELGALSFSCTGLGLGSQHPQGSLQPSITPGPGHPKPSTGFSVHEAHTCDTQAYMQTKH